MGYPLKNARASAQQCWPENLSARPAPSTPWPVRGLICPRSMLYAPTPTRPPPLPLVMPRGFSTLPACGLMLCEAPSASKQNAALPSARTLPALSSRENRPPTFSARLPAAPSTLFCSRRRCSHSFAMRGECCAEHHRTFVSAGGPRERSFKSTCCLYYLWW